MERSKKGRCCNSFGPDKDLGAFLYENAFLFGSTILSMHGKVFLFMEERNL